MRFEKGDICFYEKTDKIIKLTVESIEEWHTGIVYTTKENQYVYNEEELLTKEEMQLKLKTEYENKLKEVGEVGVLMDKVEKFKKLLEEYAYINEYIGVTYSMDKLKEFYLKKDKYEQELIKMYSELKDNNEKPVIRCECWEISGIKSEFGDDIFAYQVEWLWKEFIQKTKTMKYEEKYGMLITDDFIFIKE